VKPARSKPRAPAKLEVVLEGDRRLAEDLILEVRALAERYGLEVPTAKIVTSRPATRARPAKGGR